MAAAPSPPPSRALAELQQTLLQETSQVEGSLLALDEEVMRLLSGLDQTEERIEDAEIVRRHVLRDHVRYAAAEVEAAITRCHALQQEAALARARLLLCRSRARELRRWHLLVRAALDQLGDRPATDGTLEEGLARYRSASRQVFQIIEEERMRIARDMHDGPAQSLSNLVLRAEILERLVDREPERAKVEIQTFKDLVRGVLEETRDLIFDLRPMTLDDLGVIPTLRRLVAEYKDR